MKNTAASVRQRLLNRSKDEKRPFLELLQYYGMERFLYRLSQSEQKKNFILKGALMLQVWDSPQQRPTKDIDFLGLVNNNQEEIAKRIIAILETEVDEDGIRFDKESIHTEEIKEEADYQGVRIKFLGYLEKSRINMQIDIGFGDVVHPDPTCLTLPSILKQPPPELLCYSRESAIAEKFEAMIKLQQLNSRMKDFFDIWLLSRQFSFSGEILSEAIGQTLENRKTSIPDSLVFFQEDFIHEKQGQWKAFRKRMDQNYIPQDFAQIIQGIEQFLNPMIEYLKGNSTKTGKWSPPEKWT
jgi:hypothetical protein